MICIFFKIAISMAAGGAVAAARALTFQFQESGRRCWSLELQAVRSCDRGVIIPRRL
jgi:hypothetical protein